MKTIPQLVSPRTAAARTRLPWRVLRPELERAGYRVVRIAGRERVVEADLVEFIESCRQPTALESTDRVALAIELAAREMGIPARPRRRAKGRTEQRVRDGGDGQRVTRGGRAPGGIEHEAAEAIS